MKIWSVWTYLRGIALKQKFIGTWDRVFLRASSMKLVANMAACTCKGKGTSLQRPTVIQPHNCLIVTSDTPKPVVFSEPVTLLKGRQHNSSVFV